MTKATEPRCRACRHVDRPTLDRELAGGLSAREAAVKYGLSKDGVNRHRAHLGKALVTVQAARETTAAVSAVDRIEQLYKAAMVVLGRAEAAENGTQSLAAIKELRGLVETLAKLTGELDTRSVVNVLNLATAPEWLAVQAALLGALGPFPEARAAVAGALEDLGEVGA